jgi:hypothetical protein
MLVHQLRSALFETAAAVATRRGLQPQQLEAVAPLCLLDELVLLRKAPLLDEVHHPYLLRKNRRDLLVAQRGGGSGRPSFVLRGSELQQPQQNRAVLASVEGNSQLPPRPEGQRL